MLRPFESFYGTKGSQRFCRITPGLRGRWFLQSEGRGRKRTGTESGSFPSAIVRVIGLFTMFYQRGAKWLCAISPRRLWWTGGKLIFSQRLAQGVRRFHRLWSQIKATYWCGSESGRAPTRIIPHLRCISFTTHSYHWILWRDLM